MNQEKVVKPKPWSEPGRDDSKICFLTRDLREASSARSEHARVLSRRSRSSRIPFLVSMGTATKLYEYLYLYQQHHEDESSENQIAKLLQNQTDQTNMESTRAQRSPQSERLPNLKASSKKGKNH